MARKKKDTSSLQNPDSYILHRSDDDPNVSSPNNKESYTLKQSSKSGDDKTAYVPKRLSTAKTKTTTMQSSGGDSKLKTTNEGVGFGFSPSKDGTEQNQYAGTGFGVVPSEKEWERLNNELKTQEALDTFNENSLYSTKSSEPTDEELAAIQKAQAEAQKTSEDAVLLAASVRQSADFAEYAQANNTVTEGWNDPSSYYYINNIDGYRDKAKNQQSGDVIHDIALALNPDMASGADAAAATEHIYNKDYATYTLTDEEKSVYNYIAAKHGETAATEYLSLLQGDLNSRTSEDIEQLREIFDDGSTVGDVVGSALSVPLNVMSAAEGFGVLFGGMLGKDLAVNDPRLANSRLATGIRSDVASEMSTVGSFFYQTGMSMIDTAARLPLGNAGLLIAGGSAAAQTADEAMNNGASSTQALILAGIAGALEIVTEKVSLDKLLHAKLSGNLSGVVKAALLQGGIEASEEALSEFGNIIANSLVMKDESDWNKTVSGYIADGMTPSTATQKAIWDAIMQVGGAALGGFVSGLFFGTGGQVYGNYCQI